MAKKPAATDAYTQLKAALRSKTPAHCYIFHGEEAYLRDHYLAMLRKQLLDGPAEEFNFHRFDGQSIDLNRFFDAVEAIPMMSESSLVEVDDFDLFKLDETDREQLITVLSDVPDYCYLVFVYNTLDWKPDRRQRKLMAAIEAHAQIVEFSQPSERELTDWTAKHFLQAGKQITPELCRHIVMLTGGSMTAMASEIAKVISYSSTPVISRGDIDAVVEPVLDAVVFELTDAIANGNFALALRKLRTLLQMQEEPIPILGAIGAHLRKANAARVLMDGGKGQDSLMKLYGMGAYPAQKVCAFAKRVSPDFLARAVKLCEQTDLRLKTSYDAPERLLELLILQLAQEANPC